MYNVLIVLIVIAAILLAIIVLIQESKGGGLASGFAASNAIMGVRRTTDLIEKTTWGLAIAIVVLSVISVHLLPSQNAEASVVMKQGATTSLPSVPTGNGNAAAPVSGTQQAPAQSTPAAQQQAPAQGQGAPAGN